MDLVPALPVENPSRSYWMDPPSRIAKHGSNDTLSERADFVIIGSGITGTAVARSLLEVSDDFRVVMLEARDACSGATGRNGGHITPYVFQEYGHLKSLYGEDMAKEVIRFRLAHLSEFLRVAKEENLLVESQCREVDTHDVYFDRGLFEHAKKQLKEYLDDLPGETNDWQVLEVLEDCPRAAGAIKTKGGAIHPYRFVTGILSRLIRDSRFSLYTHTAVTNVAQDIVWTTRGSITAKHVVHATNAWASYLVERMRGRIIPVRGNMTAQPGSTAAARRWTRSFVFYHSKSEDEYDYLTQQPGGEYMLGAGFKGKHMSSDDSVVDDAIVERLSGLEKYFDDEKTECIASWSGIIGKSSDGLPWVGQLNDIEWICAGYTGEGMVHAWMSGSAVGKGLGEKKRELVPAVFSASRV